MCLSCGTVCLVMRADLNSYSMFVVQCLCEWLALQVVILLHANKYMHVSPVHVVCCSCSSTPYPGVFEISYYQKNLQTISNFYRYVAMATHTGVLSQCLYIDDNNQITFIICRLYIEQWRCSIDIHLSVKDRVKYNWFVIMAHTYNAVLMPQSPAHSCNDRHTVHAVTGPALPTLLSR